jgi:hypothetical protein
MIKFIQNKSKNWTLEGEDKKFDLTLLASSITNKFFIVTEFIERLSKFHGQEFDKWLIELFETYNNDVSLRYKTLDSNIDNIKYFVNSYLDSLNYDYDKYINESKITKSTILFHSDEIKLVIRLSSYLKIYSIFFNTSGLNLPMFLHKRIYNRLAEDVLNSDVVYKMYNIIRTKTFRYNLTDKAMWNYIKMVECKTIDSHIIEIFNFITNSILVLCKEDNNPISYFVGVVDESVKWFLRSVYKGSIIYDDSISTEDIHSLSVDNLKTYAYNDTLGRLKGIAYGKIYDDIEEDVSQKFKKIGDLAEDNELVKFQNRVSGIQFISPLSECVVFPILSKLTSIPYIHFKTLSPEHTAVLSVYTYNLLTSVFNNNYKNLFFLLNYYPNAIPSITTTYIVKNYTRYINMVGKFENFYGFNSKMIGYNILSHYIGRITRADFHHIITGKKLIGIPLAKTENDAIDYFVNFFAGNLDTEFMKMKKIMEMDF